MLKQLFVVTVLASLVYGCQSHTLAGGYQTFPKDPRRDTDAARQHNAAAVKLIADDRLDDAEKELKDALTADLFFGPAHNNLGTVYFKQKKYYYAAWEFQYAAKLMTDSPQPRNNLGLVYEEVSRPDDAAKWYDEALQLAPDSTEATANLARLRIRNNQKDDRTRQLLGDVVMKDTRPDWVAWARKELALMGTPVAPGSAESLAMPPTVPPPLPVPPPPVPPVQKEPPLESLPGK
jgi:Tfp pilus assembly protein PilF